MADIDAIEDGRIYQSGALPNLLVLALALGVNHVVDLNGDIDLGVSGVHPDTFTYVWHPIEDSAALPNLARFTALARAVADAMAAGAVLLSHCAAGINRASLFNGCVLHELHPDWSGQRIVETIRARRAGALSNQTFAAYLAGLASRP